MLEKTGIAEYNQVRNVFPTMERIKKGPVAIIECFQKIPCNPCATSCKKGAIKPFEDINDLPVINFSECNGCTMCVFNCPGLAIMIVDGSYSDTHISFKIPYEFLPLPQKGDMVKGLNRAGEVICDGEIISVVNSKIMDKTPLINVEVKSEYLLTFRNIEVVK